MPSTVEGFILLLLLRLPRLLISRIEPFKQVGYVGFDHILKKIACLDERCLNGALGINPLYSSLSRGNREFD